MAPPYFTAVLFLNIELIIYKLLYKYFTFITDPLYEK